MSNQKVILVTGPNGFIGKQFLEEIKQNYPDYILKVISRRSVEVANFNLNYYDFIKGNYDPLFFKNIEFVIHLASVAHRFDKLDLEELEQVNFEYLEKLLLVLNPLNLEKFIFLSSYAVSLFEKQVFLDTSAYAELKAKCERQIKIASEEKFKNTYFLILRPPLVYGKNAPGNFNSLLKLMSKPLILPFGDFHFKRSFIHLKNLTSFIRLLLKTEKFESKFNVIEISDPWDETFLSFISRLKSNTKAMALIIPIPRRLLKFCFSMIGRANIYKKLSLEFTIDYKTTKSKYNWINPIVALNSFDDLKK